MNFYSLPLALQIRFILASVLTDVLEVFTEVGNWISTSVPTFYSLFYVDGTGLTFLGILAVAGLSFSVVFLLIGIIQRFLHFSG